MTVQFDKVAIDLGEQLVDHPNLLADDKKLKNIIGDFVQDSDLRSALKLLVEFGYVKKLLQTDNHAKLVKLAEDNEKKLLKKNAIDEETAYIAVNFWYRAVKLERQDILLKVKVSANTQSAQNYTVQGRTSWRQTQTSTYQPTYNGGTATGENRSYKWVLLLLLLIAACVWGYYYQSRKGVLSVNIARGQVYVNGKFAAKTPCQIPLKKGTYYVKIASGNDYWKGNIVINPGETNKPLGDLVALPRNAVIRKGRKKYRSNKLVKMVSNYKRDARNKSAAVYKSSESKSQDSTAEQREHIDRIMQQVKNNSRPQPSVEKVENERVIRQKQPSSAPRETQSGISKEEALRRREENLRRIQESY